MRALIKLIAIPFLAAPLCALADTVPFISSTSGTMTTDSNALAMLGLAGPATPATLPYQLKLVAYMEPASPTFVDDSSNGFVLDPQAWVDVTLVLGTMTYHYYGMARATVSLSGDGFKNDITFGPPQSPGALADFQNYAYIVGHDFQAQPPLDPVPLNDVGPFDQQDGSLSGYVSVGDDTGSYQMNGDASKFSVMAVPEPAEYLMLAAGVLALLVAGALRSRQGLPIVGRAAMRSRHA